MIKSLDCESCHKVNEESNGPSFKKIAERYKNDSKAIAYLSHKIITGGSGAWGESTMPSHMDLSVGDARKVVTWILSLGADKVRDK